MSVISGASARSLYALRMNGAKFDSSTKDIKDTKDIKNPNAIKDTKDIKDESQIQQQKPPKVDTFEKGDGSNKVGYEPPKRLTSEQIKVLKDNVAHNMENLVSSLLGNQKNASNTLSDILEMSNPARRLSINGNKPTSSISENGEWGVKAVSDRIMNMAVALSGGDASKAEVLRNAVIKGFAQVGDVKKLPQVCQDTYKEIMNRFDHWEKNGTMDGYNKK